MNLTDLMDYDLLQEMGAQGYVRYQYHPSEPLVILNYTEKAQYEGVWNEVTSKCRGLIYDALSLEIVARPFPKFHNYSEYREGSKLGAFQGGLDEPVVVTDKLDGSLGIAYLRPSDGAWCIATRGSFTSEQALHGTELLQEYYRRGGPQLCYCHTFLFEIVYPENRIVVDYGDRDELVLLGAMAKDCPGCEEPGCEEDVFMSPSQCVEDETWSGPVAEQFGYETFREALAAKSRPGKEGLVVYFPERDVRVKLKQEDYVALHRIVTGLNERTVWEAAKVEGGVAKLQAMLPEEFAMWTYRVYGVLMAEYTQIIEAVHEAHRVLCSRLGGSGFARKDYALLAKQLYPELLPYMFLRLDCQWDKLKAKVWEDTKPPGKGVEGGKA